MASVIATIEYSELALVEITIVREFSIDMLLSTMPCLEHHTRGHRLSLEGSGMS